MGGCYAQPQPTAVLYPYFGLTELVRHLPKEALLPLLISCIHCFFSPCGFKISKWNTSHLWSCDGQEEHPIKLIVEELAVTETSPALRSRVRREKHSVMKALKRVCSTWKSQQERS